MKATMIAVAVLLSMTLQAEAQTTHLVITDVPSAPGSYYLVVTRSADGSLSVSRISSSHIVSLSDDPQPPPNGPPNEHEKLHNAVVGATAAVVDNNKVNAQRAVSKLYSSLSALPFQTRKALQTSTDLMFEALGLNNSWGTWKGTVDEALSVFTGLKEAKVAWQVVSQAVAP